MRLKNKILPVMMVVLLLSVCGCRQHESAQNEKITDAGLLAHQPLSRALFENAIKYINPDNGIIDNMSGYPVEGWNNDAVINLRTFTQLTAIGEWVELLADIIAGQADNQYISTEQATVLLRKVVDSLLVDQENAELSFKGLLVNFMGFENGRRVGPLVSTVAKTDFYKLFGKKRGEDIWQALREKKWLVCDENADSATVKRGGKYGRKYFTGVLLPYADDAVREKIMTILDQRGVTVIFGDNVNLTASVAKGIGALLNSSMRNEQDIIRLRERMENFIENQRDGYNYFYDKDAGSFAFGRNVSAGHFIGWKIDTGEWVVGRMNYFINEFRGGWMFVVLRFGLPEQAIRSGSITLKPYLLRDGKELYVPAAWDGSAFQILGLSLFMQERTTPGWRELLRNAAMAEVDYSERHKLPGFLSEAYSGCGNEYTGKIGIPELAVTKEKRITDAPSLYTLGVAYSILPGVMDAFMNNNRESIFRLFTEHGPWEGFNTTKKSIIKFQTTAHTLSLILGLIDTGNENMMSYLKMRKLQDKMYRNTANRESVNYLKCNIFGWNGNGGKISVANEDGKCVVRGENIGDAYLAVVSEKAVDLRGGKLCIRYKAGRSLEGCILQFKSSAGEDMDKLNNNAVINFYADDKPHDLEIPIPPVPGMSDVKELVFMLVDKESRAKVDLTIEKFNVEF